MSGCDPCSSTSAQCSSSLAALRSFLGTRAVKVTTVQVHGKAALLALSTRSYLGYTHQVSQRLTSSPILLYPTPDPPRLILLPALAALHLPIRTSFPSHTA